MSGSVKKNADQELAEVLSQSERRTVAQICQKIEACRSLDVLEVEIETGFLSLFGAESVCFGKMAEDLSAHTVRSHVKRIYRQLNVNSKTQLILILAKE